MTPRVVACVFDVYGTLLDVDSAVRRHADRIGPAAPSLAAIWRAKQLEYTWTRTLMREYVDFWGLTQQALDHALAEVGIADSSLRAQLLDAYHELDAYPDVKTALENIRAAGYRLAVLSNGTREMLAAGLDSGELASLFEDVISVEEIGVHKPARAVYELATRRLGLAPAEISFQSANAWDVAGSHAAGFRAVWLNRAGSRDEYGLRSRVSELPTLTALPVLLEDGAVLELLTERSERSD